MDVLKNRTKRFALHIIDLVERLPRRRSAEVIARQLLRSGTSVAANYRAACRARSKADFVNKMAIVEEEADESRFWMELLTESGVTRTGRIDGPMKEADELLAMTVASIRTARGSR